MAGSLNRPTSPGDKVTRQAAWRSISLSHRRALRGISLPLAHRPALGSGIGSQRTHMTTAIVSAVIAVVVAFVTTLLAAPVRLLVEQRLVHHRLLTTVGYGDIYPSTDTGRLVAILVMVVGIDFLSLLIGSVSERFMAASVEQGVDDVEREVEEEVDAVRAELVAELRAMGERLRQLEARL